MAFSKVLHELLATWICLCCYMDVTMLLHVFLALCQTKPSCLQVLFLAVQDSSIGDIVTQ